MVCSGVTQQRDIIEVGSKNQVLCFQISGESRHLLYRTEIRTAVNITLCLLCMSNPFYILGTFY